MLGLASCGLPAYVGQRVQGTRAEQSAERTQFPADPVDPRLLQDPTLGCPIPAVQRHPPANKQVALTFDDGPAPGDTEQILQLLAEEKVWATFFNVGKFSTEYPDLEHRVSQAGHVIGVHGFSHTRFTTLTTAEMLDEVRTTAQAVVRNTGRPVCLVRPPYGAVNPTVNATLLDAGYTVALWNVDSRDWTLPGVAQVVRHSFLGVTGQPVTDQPVTVLMHSSLQLTHPDDTNNRSVAAGEGAQDITPEGLVALRAVIRRYKQLGYTFVTVDGRPFPRAAPTQPSPTETAPVS